jgi:membrane-bound lytic murein transglycosylase D
MTLVIMLAQLQMVHATSLSFPFAMLKHLIEPDHAEAHLAFYRALGGTQHLEEVKKWVHHYLAENRKELNHQLERGARYRDAVEDILRENGVPAEVYYVGMVESGYLAESYSPKDAVGFWQITGDTAARIGLTVNYDEDDRLKLRKSTQAAAKYLKSMHDEFGSWALAIAAYNCGDNHMRRMIEKYQSHDFWELVSLHAFKRETVEYIPKILAIMTIDEDHKRYGIGTTARTRSKK